jgi:RNA-directed DNA polymerase
MSAIEERISDRHVLKLLRAMLRAGVMQDGAVRRDVTGTPQGGVISPVLCNVYLHRLDRQWAKRGTGVLVRFADDLVVLCHSKREAEAALVSLRTVMAEMGLELKHAKTRIVHLQDGGEGLVFLGFEHRLVHARKYRHFTYLARWPSREAMQRARQRIREITDRKRLLLPVEMVVQDLNRYLRGWANYFRYGNSAQHFNRISTYALERLARFMAKRHKRASGFGWTVVHYWSSNHLGLINLDGTVVSPRANKPWREKPNAWR